MGRRHGINMMSPGKLHRSGPTGQEKGEGEGQARGSTAAVPVATRLDPRCVSDRSATTQEGGKQGLACRPSVRGLELLGEGYFGVAWRGMAWCVLYCT